MCDGYDIVIASHYKDDASSEDDDMITGFRNWLFTKTVNRLFGGHYADVMVIYQAFRKDMISSLELDQDEDCNSSEKLFLNHFRETSWEPLLLVLRCKYGYRVADIPAYEPPRIGGVRKLRVINWGAAYYTQFWIEFFRPTKEPRLKKD